MGKIHIQDWAVLPGTDVEIRRNGMSICSGFVDAVTGDGEILWLTPLAQCRRLFEKADLYEAWVMDDRDGFHYEISKGQQSNELGPDGKSLLGQE